jgi:hypothetical protein
MLVHIRRVLRKLRERFLTKSGLKFVTVSKTELGKYQFLVLDNGHDYEVKVLKENELVYHCVSFSTKEDAESFLEFYRRNLHE